MLDLQRTDDVHLARQGHKKADQYAFIVAGRMCVCDGSEQVTCTGGGRVGSESDTSYRGGGTLMFGVSQCLACGLRSLCG